MKFMYKPTKERLIYLIREDIDIIDEELLFKVLEAKSI